MAPSSNSNAATIRPWQEVVAEKRALRDAALEPYINSKLGNLSSNSATTNILEKSQIQPQAAQDITDVNDIHELHTLLAKGDITAEDVVLAYFKRSTVAHRLTNAFTEVLFDDALQRARKLDHHFHETGRVVGPLHGIPITLKDQFNIKGVDTTLGYVGRAFMPAVEDAVLVSILQDLGGVIIAKTNLPQSIMWCETENPLWGLTVNPRNPDFTPGGSTGGESVLQALHGSLIGFGTDIGGSVRIPQGLMGLYGLKPSSSRFPYQGVRVSTEGQEHVPSSVGPMTRTLSSLTYITRAVVESQPWSLDPRCCPLPWREMEFQEIQSRPLVIGVMLDDGVVKVHPPIDRALRELEAKLKAAGHEIVTWDPSGHKECIAIMDQYYTADGCEDIRRDVEAGGEPYIPHVEALVNRGKPISVYQYWQLNKQKFAVQKQYMDKWNAVRSPSDRPVDVLLTPTMPHVAVPHRSSRWVGYTKIWNFLDYTALSFPVSTVSADSDDPNAGSSESRSELDAWNRNLYDLKSMDGHPVSLQIVGRKLEEEKVLGAAAVIQKIWQC